MIDLSMPELTGFEVLNAIQRDELPTASSSSPPPTRASRSSAPSPRAPSPTSRRTRAAMRSATRSPPPAAARSSSRRASRAGSPIRSATAAGWSSPPLTPREREVLQLTGEGLSAPEIGYQLHIAAATVKAHMQSVYGKLGVSDRPRRWPRRRARGCSNERRARRRAPTSSGTSSSSRSRGSWRCRSSSGSWRSRARSMTTGVWIVVALAAIYCSDPAGPGPLGFLGDDRRPLVASRPTWSRWRPR